MNEKLIDEILAEVDELVEEHNGHQPHDYGFGIQCLSEDLFVGYSESTVIRRFKSIAATAIAAIETIDREGKA